MFKGSVNEMDFSKSMENLKAFSKSYDDILFEVNKYKTNEAIRNERRLKNRLKTYVHRLKKRRLCQGV